MHFEGQIPQNYHTFALFDTPKMGNLMAPEKSTQQKMLKGDPGLPASASLSGNSEIRIGSCRKTWCECEWNALRQAPMIQET